MEVISILAGGPSAQRVPDLNALPGYVIGVNDAGIRVRCDAIVSMDRLWTEYRWPDLQEMEKPTFLRKSALKNCQGRWEGLYDFDNDYQTGILSDASGTLNGPNSGHCAFNLAYQRLFMLGDTQKRILLFGFDMKRRDKPYWWPTYPWNDKGATTSGKYAAWARAFDQTLPQLEKARIEVINFCEDSGITAFQRVKPEALR